MLNSWEVIGNLGNDPEVRAIQHGANSGQSFTTFSVAVNSKQNGREDKTMWVNVSAFGKTGEAVAKYMKKGSKIFVRGALELQEYEGKDGKNHASLKLLADKVEFLSSKEGTNGSSSEPVPQKVAVGADEDIPF